MAEPLRPKRHGGSMPEPPLSPAYADAMRYAQPIDMSKFDIADTARAARETAQRATDTNALLGALVQASIDQDARERQMLRWTVASVSLAGIAAVASLVALFLR